MTLGGVGLGLVRWISDYDVDGGVGEGGHAGEAVAGAELPCGRFGGDVPRGRASVALFRHRGPNAT